MSLRIAVPVIWLGLVMAAGWAGAALPPWRALVLFLAVAAPAAMAGVYLSAVRRAHALDRLHRATWPHRLLEGHWLRVVLVLAAAGWLGVQVVAEVAIHGRPALGWLAATVVLGGGLAWAAYRSLGNWRTFARTARAMIYGAVLAGIAVALAWGLAEVAPDRWPRRRAMPAPAGCWPRWWMPRRCGGRRWPGWRGCCPAGYRRC